MSLVGKDIVDECTKCKLLLAHIVLYEVGGKVKKVKCKTCGAEHVYRGVTQKRKESGPATLSRQEKKIKAAAKGKQSVNDIFLDWEKKRIQMDQTIPVKDYHMKDTYKTGDTITHPIFGLGFVGQVSGTNMEVLFKDSIKKMAKGVINH